MNGWKITAFVFILLFLAESFLIVYSYNLAKDVNTNDIKCSNEVCFNIGSTSYIYDSYNKLCTCYTNGESTYQEILK
jgi:hypothetical protein